MPRLNTLAPAVPKLDKTIFRLLGYFESGRYDLLGLSPDKAGILLERLIKARLMVEGNDPSVEGALIKLQQHITSNFPDSSQHKETT